MKIVKSNCAVKEKVRTFTFSPQVNIKNKREPIQTQEDINAAHSEAKIQDLVEDLKNVIYKKVKAVATSESFGFDEDEVNDYFFVDVTPAEIGEDHHEAVRVEVRAEVSYEGLEELMEALNPIIESYDSYAYFEPVEPGIIEAYVSVDQIDMSVYGATNSPDHMFYDYHGERFSVHDNSSEIGEDNIDDVYFLWKGNISQQAGAYNDADEDYVYAFIRGRGVIEYYKKGKYVATDNYTLRDEDDFEYAWEYMEIILQHICDRLIAYNKDVPDRMIYNSTNVDASDNYVFIEDIIDKLEEAGYDLSRIRSIRRGLLELFGYKGKDADIIIHDLVAGRFIDPNDWVDKDYTPGVYSATEEEYDEEELQDIIDELTADGFDVTDEADLLMGLGADLGMDRADARYYAKLILNHIDDSSVLGAEEDEDSLPMVDQEYDSAATSINSNKLPAIYKMVNFNQGDVVVDFGGGKFDNAVEYIKDKGATLVVYDPYNRSAEHNKEVLKILRENGGADAAVNSNVLNVIKEPEARKNVLENIARIAKPGAPIYITVYEGKGNGQEGPTKSGYQLNRKTADYLEEIQEVFPDATRRGKLITAHNSGSVTSSTDDEGMYDDYAEDDFDARYDDTFGEPSTEVFTYITNRGGYYIYRAIVDGKGKWRAMDNQLDDSKFDEFSFPISYDQARGYEPIDQPNEISHLRKKLGDTLLSKDKSINSDSKIYERFDKDIVDYSLLDKKHIQDFDGFYTDCTLYEVALEDGSTEYECYVGDTDLYGPWNGEGLQFESQSKDEAIEQFESQDNLDDEEDLFTTSEIDASISADEFFTKEDLIELTNIVEDDINQKLQVSTPFKTSDAYIEGNIVHVEVQNDEWVITGDAKIDFRKIRKPSDLNKYAPDIVDSMVAEYNEYQDPEDIDDSVETSSAVNADAFSDLEDEWLSPPEYDDPIEHEDSEELVEVELDQIITVDVDGDYEWDDDTYVWASPDRSNEEWRSEDGVYIDDKVGVVEHIDDLIIPNVPTRPGKYRVTGLAELVYDVSGIQEYRTEYGPEDYDSDIDIDHSVVAFNFRKSEVQNLKVTPVRR